MDGPLSETYRSLGKHGWLLKTENVEASVNYQPAHKLIYNRLHKHEVFH